MREKRYSKDMKGTQEEEKEREGGIEEAYMEVLEDGAIREYVNMLELYFFGKSYREPEEKKAKEKEVIREVFAGAGVELEETERGDYTMAF